MSRPEYLKLPNNQIVGATQLPTLPRPRGGFDKIFYGGWVVEKCNDKLEKQRDFCLRVGTSFPKHLSPEDRRHWVKYIPGVKDSRSYWLTPTAAVTNIIDEYWILRVYCDFE